MEQRDAFQEWLKGRPECIHKLAAEFPLGTRVLLDGKMLHLVGYGEPDSLLMSEIDPAEDYEGAVESRAPLCASHLRAAVSASPEQK